MKSYSLRRRLLAGCIVAIVLATVLGSIGIEATSRATIRALAVSEIEDEMSLLLASIEIRPSNELSVDDGPQDPRFDLPNGGFYWQVGRGGKVELRSRSLWNQSLPWLNAGPRDVGRASDLAGPGKTQLIAMERTISISGAAGDQSVTAMVALDNDELAPARWRFFYAMGSSLAVLMVALLAAVISFVRYGLRPLDELRLALIALRDRAARTIAGRFPDEIQPVVDDLNALIELRDAQLMRARERAGDLAHGLKTPLAVLEATARRLEDEGSDEHSRAIQDEVKRMRTQVRRTLAYTRASLAAAQSVNSFDASRVLVRLVSAMRKLSAGKAVDFSIEGTAGSWLAMDETDFTEIMGNLIDNARKWANTTCRITVRAAGSDNAVRVSVEDDGPGLPLEDGRFLIQRGRRLDETVSGSGFGLAIAKDLVEAYGGRLDLASSPLGGLAVKMDLPRGRPHAKPAANAGGDPGHRGEGQRAIPPRG